MSKDLWETLTLRFQDRDPELVIEVRPAVPALNPDYAAAIAKNFGPYQVAFQAGKLTETTANRILARTFAESVVVSWEGSDAELTKSNVIAFLLDDQSLFDDIKAHAADPAVFVKKRVGDGYS